MPSRPLTHAMPDVDSQPFAQNSSLSMTVREALARQPQLPLPGSGFTLERWRALSLLASSDVCLSKVLEAHYDAQAILAELGQSLPPFNQLLAVWAAEPPDAQVDCTKDANAARITGTKAWCSGASMVDGALLTTRCNGASQLVYVDMREAGVSPDESGWEAVGMARVVSGRVRFANVPAQPIGLPGAYLARAGFWHGGAGIAACWFGAAVAVADTLRTHPRTPRDTHACAHLGAIDVLLSSAAAHLRELAAQIDAQPLLSHRVAVMQVRSLLERTCTKVIDRVGRALGPGPLCQDREHALRCSDLAVFIRQTHAERDWAALGEAAAERSETWAL